jgi:N4-gp56 family major capsid protein
MAVISSTSPASIADQYQTYFSKKLLEYAVQSLRKAEFANQAPLPKNAGAKSIRFFRFGEPDATLDGSTGIQTLTEGTAMAASKYRELTLEYVDATLVQYGQVIGMTDILNNTSLLNMMSQASKTNGEDAALHMDTIVRDELVNTGDADESDSRTKRYSGGAATFAALAGLTNDEGKTAATDALDAVTNLKINRAPQIGGQYVCVAPPQVTRDLMNDTDWLQAHKYSDVQPLYKGEVGSFHGTRFIEDTNPYIEDDGTKGTYNSGGNVFTSFFLGGDAYGVPQLAGDSPKSPQVLITDGPDKSDPLNQLVTVGWKVFWTAKVLNSNYFVVQRSKTNYS